MPDLLRSEPAGREKLYKGVEDAEVDGTTETFTWEWIRKATKIKKKASFTAHLEKGHFGAFEQISSSLYRFSEGHRAICRFNNGRHTNQKTIVVSKEQYEDMMAGRPVRNMPVMVRGKPVLKSVSIKTYNRDEFIAVSRYTVDQARGMALERVENDIKEKTVSWHGLSRDSDEFRERAFARMKMFEDLLLAEMVLMARDIASKSDLRAAADLPASILNLIDYKLSASQAEYYISRFIAARVMIPEIVSNPFMAFRVHQVILEQMQVEHYRDLQRLHGDSVDKGVQAALDGALARLNKLMPGGLMKIEPTKTPDADEPTNGRTGPARVSVAGDPFEM